MNNLYKYFFRGLITVLPVALTLYLLYIFLAWTEKLTLWMLSPLIGSFYIPGMGLVSGVLIILLIGYMVSKPKVSRLFSFAELPFTNLPVVKSIYTSLKNFADYFASHDKPQQQVVLLSMPGHELAIVGLITRRSLKGLPRGLGDLDDRVAVYVPMGYMIGGYTVFVPRSWTSPIDMSVEEAMRSTLIAFMASNPADPEP